MKTNKFFILCFGAGLILAGCNNQEAQKEDKVGDFAKTFAQFVSQNQKDSLLQYYPEAATADSLALTYVADSITVTPGATEGTYTITFNPNASLTATVDSLGNITVTESTGLFAYPAERLALAQQTGQWLEGANDVAQAERMNDADFTAYLEKKSKVSTAGMISVGKFVVTKEWEGPGDTGSGYNTLTNNTDQPIKGTDYVVIERIETPMGDPLGNSTSPGKDIPAHGSVKFTNTFDGHSFTEVTGVKMQISDADLKARNTPSYKGTEYEEYLKTKK